MRAPPQLLGQTPEATLFRRDGTKNRPSLSFLTQSKDVGITRARLGGPGPGFPIAPVTA